jgi:hypothetical protein
LAAVLGNYTGTPKRPRTFNLPTHMYTSASLPESQFDFFDLVHQFKPITKYVVHQLKQIDLL